MVNPGQCDAVDPGPSDPCVDGVNTLDAAEDLCYVLTDPSGMHTSIFWDCLHINNNDNLYLETLYIVQLYHSVYNVIITSDPNNAPAPIAPVSIAPVPFAPITFAPEDATFAPQSIKNKNFTILLPCVYRMSNHNIELVCLAEGCECCG